MVNPIKKNIQARSEFFKKVWISVFVGILLLGTFAFSGDLLKGDVFQGGNTKTDAFYIPDYPANAGDVGDIRLISSNAVSNLAGVSFTLVYNANQITIADNTVSGNFDFINSKNIAPWRLKVIGASGAQNGKNLSAGADLVRIDKLNLSSGLANGEVLELKVEDFEIVTSVNGTLTSEKNHQIWTSKITIGAIGTLELLSAESLDEESVKLTFSDYVSTIGTYTFDNGLTQVSAVINPDDWKSVLLTTTQQTQGTLYEVVASGTIGNSQGSLAENNKAYFTGKTSIASESDFDLETAVASSATWIVLTFSDAVLDGSVYKDAFLLQESGTWITLNIGTVQKSTENNQQILLTLTAGSLLDWNKNYKIILNNTGLSTDLRRQNDNALLRKDIAVFAGFSENLPANQFGVTRAEAVASNQLKVVFSENLSAPTVDVADFGLQGFNITNLTIPYEGAYDKVLLNLDSDLSTGQYYVLTVNNLNNLDAYSGNTLGNENATVFVGYGASEDRSNLALTSATVNSETQVTLSFNQAPLASTVIPVNFAIKPNLTITNAIVSGNNVVLTTSVQDEGVSYTVIAKADKVKDQDQLLISSQNTTTFTGYKSFEPVLDSVTPNQVVNDVENEISISGTNFETGTEVYLNTLKLTSTLTTTMIQAKVPFEQDAGVYDLILKRPNGEQIKLENALVVENPVQNIEVLTAESYASPKLVPNDGATPTTFWVRISDPKGVSDIDSVTMDLRPIDGSPAQIMQPEGIVDNKRWYSLELTVPNTVSTSAVPIALEVVAQNKAGDRAYGTVTLTVNNDLTSSIPPVVEKAYATPDALSPGSDDDIYFYAYVRDDDGANTLHNVTINLWPLGGAPMIMKPIDSGNETSTNNTNTTSSSSSGSSAYLKENIQNLFLPKALATFVSPTANGEWYVTQKAFRLPSNKRAQFYSLIVTATDQTGEIGELTFTVRTDVSQNKPFVDEDRVSVISNTWTDIPNDNESTFVVEAFVEDPDGIDDIASVEIDLNEIGLPVMEMKTTAKVGIWGMYRSESIKVPEGTFIGIKTLTIYARDLAWGEGEAGVQINIKNIKKMGNAPEIANGHPSYTTPKSAKNDEATKISLYAFVSDKDDDVDYVTINLSGVARYVAETWSGQNMNGYYEYKTEEEFNPCSTNSDTIMCMFPSVREGIEGRWYVLPDVVVLEDATPQVEPYKVWVTATDKTGKTSKSGYININVSDGQMPSQEVGYPTVRLASATSPSSVEVLFSNPITKTGMSKTGKEFLVTEKDNTSAKLNITKAVINAEGTIVTLNTSVQEAGMNYTLIADAQKLGLKNNQVADTLANFTGYEDDDIPPQVSKVEAISSYLVKITLNEKYGAIKPTSIHSDGSNFKIFTTDETPEYLAVHRAEMENQYTILLTTDAQIANLEYRISMKEIESSSGRAVKESGLTKEFRGFRNILHNSWELRMTADFNGDGEVNFTDFTIFSSVYGQTWQAIQSGEFTNLDEALENSGITEPFNPVDTTTPVPLD